jgi:Holliday junction resolvase RusA-like endonuclease
VKLSFVVVGRPRGQQRHRVGKGRTYTPNQTVDYQKLIRQAFSTKHTGSPHPGPVRLEVIAHLPRPKGHYGTGRNAGNLKDSAPYWPLLKPDFDNIAKIVADALNGLAYLDDKQVIDAHCVKFYELTGSVPCIHVTLTLMEQETVGEHRGRLRC